VILSTCSRGGARGGQPGSFDRDERYAPSAAGDPLARLGLVVDFALFRGELDVARARIGRRRAGRLRCGADVQDPGPADPSYTLSDDQPEYQIRDRLSFIRFSGRALEGRVPDAKTIWLFREQLARLAR
jgi:transposase, IS5 family